MIAAPPACLYVLRHKGTHALHGVFVSQTDAYDARAAAAIRDGDRAFDLEVVTYQPPFTL